MTTLGPPPNWEQVGLDEFLTFLKVCADYTRTSFYGGAEYRYRHNNEMFAYVAQDSCGIDVIYAPTKSKQ